MTLADRLELVLREHGPLPACVLAPTVRKQKAEVIAALHADPRFTRTGKARRSRWDVQQVPAIDEPPVGIDADELARRWEALLGVSPDTAATFVEEFVAGGVLERIDGNGRVRATDRGRELIAALMTGGGE